jgi:hypothetical protein
MSAGVALLLALSVAGAPTPAKPTRLRIDVKPETAVVFIDGVKKGTGKKTILLSMTPGRHRIKVTNDKDAVDDYVVVKKGETANWQYAFEDDRPATHKPVPPTGDEGSGDAEKPDPDKPKDAPAPSSGESP